MNQAALLFPGQVLAYHVVDYAIDWAKENEGSLKVIFFLPKSVPKEGYPFPNDLDQAEMLKDTFDADAGLRHILHQEIRYIEKRASARHIPVQCEILFSPSLDELLEKIEGADMVLFDKNIDDNTEVFEGLSFSAEDIREKNIRIFAVGEFDRYSDVFY